MYERLLNQLVESVAHMRRLQLGLSRPPTVGELLDLGRAERDVDQLVLLHQLPPIPTTAPQPEVRV